MDYLLQTNGLYWVLGIATGCIVLATAWYAALARRSKLQGMQLRELKEILAKMGEAIEIGQARVERSQEDLFVRNPDLALAASGIIATMFVQTRNILRFFQSELELSAAKSFWPNFWMSVSTNFLVGMVFFILGVVITLLTTQPH
jgi:hypothetical protein